MFFSTKRYVRRIYHRIKRPILWVFFMIYQALTPFPGKQKQYFKRFEGYPSIQLYIESKKELAMIFPYRPQSSRNLSADARKLYDTFLKNNKT